MGNRAQRRALQKQGVKVEKPKTYTFTKEGLEKYVKDAFAGELRRVKDEATNDAVNQAMILLLTLPLEVLMDHYWQKSYRQRIPKFTELVLEYYERWQNGEIDLDELKADLWEYGGVRFEER